MTTLPCIGIDLGTSNSAIAVSKSVSETPEVIPIAQISGPQAVRNGVLLPSAAYVLLDNERQNASFTLPWGETGKEIIVGEYARERGALLPDRLAMSVKSWLCSRTVDAKSKFLPFNSHSVTDKFSPFEISRRYLTHLRHALSLHSLTKDELTGGLIEDTGSLKTVLTVPASFDEVARTLTHEAAVEAGWQNVILLEEPQAAFYAWIAANQNDWRRHVSSGDLVLVCDVGGGTADFSLIAVSESEGNLELERVSVGEHILLGGDNMDLALAFTIRHEAEEKNKALDDWQFQALVQSCRHAKERLLSDNSLDTISLSIPTRSSSLLASTISLTLTRELLTRVLLEGFFPLSNPQDLPALHSRLGLQEFGLDYASDAAISKHLARFLQLSAVNIKSENRLASMCESKLVEVQGLPFLFPNKILFNGGVFKSSLIRERVLKLLGRWCGDSNSIEELPGADYDLAVARGAAHYAMISEGGQGIRIRAGLARSYYVGLETSMLAVPGYKPPIKGLCVAPQGTEEGTEHELTSKEFGLRTGQSVSFRFFSSAVRAGDIVGSIAANAEEELTETASLSIKLQTIDGEETSAPIPVHIHSRLTEVGTLELWLQHTQSEHKWKLEFSLRGQ